jgi:[ribosomal protein S5]-alanine N-acetyltransferase
MEMMPYRPAAHRPERSHLAPSLPTWGPAAEPDWREGLPVLRSLGFTLRELHSADAAPLAATLTTAEVSRFISPPPTDVAGFGRFIAWAQRERAAGRYACFAVVPDGDTHAVGIFQVRLIAGREGVAEWGFILGQAYWGTGLFLAGAQRVVDFAFETMGLHRLEARAAIANVRGNGALAKLGAFKEAVLRQSFERRGERLDQALWAVLRDDWWAARASHHPVTHVPVHHWMPS